MDEKEEAPNGASNENFYNNYTFSLWDIQEPNQNNDDEIEDAVPFPIEINEKAYYGLSGDMTKFFLEYSEASPVAILITLLVFFGNAVGRKPYILIGGAKHYTNLFASLIGSTGEGRKGTSAIYPLKIFEYIEPLWKDNRIQSGLSDGEGLIYNVRDKVTIKRFDKKTQADVEEVVDYGVEDKRLMVFESEFGRALKVMQREGNTLSSVIRQAYESRSLRVLTKNNPVKATDTHISILAHITKEELLKLICENDLVNGLANRFLWFCVRRSKFLPNCGQLPFDQFTIFIEKLKQAYNYAKSVDEIKMSPQVLEEWSKLSNVDGTPGIYELLHTQKEGVSSSLISRGTDLVLRLAAIYALLDLSNTIHMSHLTAGLALWDFNLNSLKFIFGQAEDNPKSSKVLTALKDSPQGLTQTEIYRDIFKSNIPSNQIKQILENLSAKNKINVFEEKNKRPTNKSLEGSIMGILSILESRDIETTFPTKPAFHSQTEKLKEERENLLMSLGKKLKESEALGRENNLYVKNGDIDNDVLIEKLFKLVYLLCGDEVFYRMNVERLK